MDENLEGRLAAIEAMLAFALRQSGRAFAASSWDGPGSERFRTHVEEIADAGVIAVPASAAGRASFEETLRRIVELSAEDVIYPPPSGA